MNENDTESGLSVEMNRRQMLRGVAASPVAALALPVEASAASDVDVTVEQGGEVATVSPITADRSVEDFYRYDRGDGSSANTPGGLEQSDASRLFFYQPSGGGPLSLVVIHDAPNDGDGGDARFDFQPELSTSGSWVVKDDPAHAPDNFGRQRATWGWGGCCTDGGAYRGGFDDGFEVTVDPSFSGIDSWELLDGDGSVAATLSQSDPVTFAVGSDTAPGDLGELIDEKDARIQGIRGAVPQEFESDPSRVDARAEQFLDTAREVDDSGSPGEREQYEEALSRLNDSEQLMLAATRGPLRDVIPKTSSLVIKAALALATEGIVRLARFNVKDRALGFIKNRILGGARSIKDTTIQHIPTGETSVTNPEELGTLFDEGYFTLARFFDETIGHDPDLAENYFEEVTRSGIVIGSFEVADTAWGDDLEGVVEDAYDQVKTAIDTLMYRIYYFDAPDPTSLVDLPDLSLPSDVESYSVDVPDWISSLSGAIPDEISTDGDLPTGEFSGGLSELTDAFARAEPFLNLVSFPTPDVTSSGINSIMRDSVEALAVGAEDGRLDSDAREARLEAASSLQTVLEGANDVLSLAFTIYEELSNALEVTTVAAFAALIGLIGTSLVVGTEASLLFAGVTVGTAISQLLSILYILGWVELIFIAAQGLTLVAAVLFFHKAFATGTLVVNNLPTVDLEGV